MTGEVSEYSFLVTTNIYDGRPTYLRIFDSQTGVSVDLLDSSIKASFVNNRHVSISLEKTKQSRQIILECWTQ
ncbi:MAG: hypothetical protein V4654_04920 [Bdellovibrionota bacterium]